MTDRTGNLIPRNRTDRPGKTSSHRANIDEGRENTSIPHDQPRARSRINDNYCVTKLRARLLAGSTHKETLTFQDTVVKLNVVNHALSATGHPQRKGISPGLADVKNRSYIKICQRCFFCHSIVLCPTCGQCPSCCKNSACRVQTSKLLANLAGIGCRSENSSNIERGLHPSLSDPAKSHKVSHCHKLLCQSPQEQLPVGGITSAYGQKRNRTRPQSDISGVFNRLFLVPKPNNKWRPILDLSKLNLFLKVEKFKMETPETIRTSLQQGEWVTSVDFKDAYFHIPIQEQSRKYLRFHVQGWTYQFKALPFGLSTAPMEFTVLAKEVKLMAIHKGIRIHQYLDDWLVRASSHSICLQHTQTLVKMCQDLGWLVNTEKSELEPKQISLQLCRLPVRPQVRPGQTDTGPVAQPSGENTSTFVTTGLSGPAVHVPDRSTNSHGKTSSPRSTTHETHTVASQKQLEGTGISRKDYPSTQVPAPTLTMVARGKQCAPRATITPNKTCSANIYRRIKRRVGHPLKRTHCKRVLVSAGKQAAYKLPGTESSFSSLK